MLEQYPTVQTLVYVMGLDNVGHKLYFVDRGEFVIQHWENPQELENIANEAKSLRIGQVLDIQDVPEDARYEDMLDCNVAMEITCGGKEVIDAIIAKRHEFSKLRSFIDQVFGENEVTKH